MSSEAHWSLVPRPPEKGPLRRLTAKRSRLVWADSRRDLGHRHQRSASWIRHVLWGGSGLRTTPRPVLTRLGQETRALLMSRPCHKLTGARSFPSPGLSFHVSAVSQP